MAYDEGLAQRIRDITDQLPQQFEEKKMFGGLSFLLNGKMSIGVVKEQVVSRVMEEDRAGYLALPGVDPMDFTGRAMKGFVYLSGEAIESDEDLAMWVQRAIDYVNAHN